MKRHERRQRGGGKANKPQTIDKEALDAGEEKKCEDGGINNDEFDRELCWCIQQIQLGLQKQRPDAKQVSESVRILKVLKNPNALLVKKRQMMRSKFGDYRTKMRQEEKRYGITMKGSMKAVTKKQKQWCTFLKKATRGLQEKRSTPQKSIVVIEKGFKFQESGEDFQFRFVTDSSGNACAGNLETLQNSDLEKFSLTGETRGAFKFNFNLPCDDPDSNVQSVENDKCAVMDLEEGVISMKVSEPSSMTEQKGDAKGNPFSGNISTKPFSFNFEVDGET